MPYCHKRYYIAKGKCAFVTKICSLMLMVTVFILGASIRVCAPCRTRQSLLLLHRCYAHYTSLAIVVLFVHHDTTPLCCVHVIVLPNRCASYYAHSSNVRLIFPVHILYFFTMPCIFWHYPRHRGFCCIIYNNISILSSLTANLMC